MLRRRLPMSFCVCMYVCDINRMVEWDTIIKYTIYRYIDISQWNEKHKTLFVYPNSIYSHILLPYVHAAAHSKPTE